MKIIVPTHITISVGGNCSIDIGCAFKILKCSVGFDFTEILLPERINKFLLCLAAFQVSPEIIPNLFFCYFSFMRIFFTG